MANAIASQTIPQWVNTHLGKRVKFVAPYDFYGDGSARYSVGDIATLDGIQASAHGPEAIVYFDDDPSLLLNPPIGSVAPIE